jgi:dipeptidyl aminopeptidase/acylaminoacyl peptidase
MKRSFIVLLLAVAPLAAATPTPEQLVEYPSVSDVKLSPSGKHLAVRVFNGEKHILQLLNRESLSISGGFATPTPEEVGAFHWASDDRLVAELVPMRIKDDERLYNELFAINPDAQGLDMLMGPRAGEMQTGTHIKRKDTDLAWASVADPLPDNPRYVMVSKERDSRNRRLPGEIVLLDIFNGVETDQGINSGFGQGKFFTNTVGEVRAMTSVRPDSTVLVETRSDDGEWKKIKSLGASAEGVAVTRDEEHFYVLDYGEKDNRGLHRVALDGSGVDHVYTNDEFDITEVALSNDGGDVYAVRIDRSYPSYLMFSRDDEEAAVFKELLGIFQGNLVSIRSRSKDGNYWVIKASTDVNAGTFYLFDREKKQLSALFEARDGLKQDQLAQMEPVEFSTFDGQKVHGYFTAPKGKSAKNAPMVVLVHDGPGNRDYWGYHPWVQLLATRGYAVLQVNYRGSAGYGKAFKMASQHQWGDAIQRDIIAGTRWAIENLGVDKKRVCIMGHHFGAYSAAQSASMAPDLYKCVVADDGFYNLALLHETGAVDESYVVAAYLDREIGHDENELARFSPVNNAGKIRATVFIAHNKRNKDVPIRHARELRKAISNNVWFEKPTDAYGYYGAKQRKEFVNAVLDFLDGQI